MTTPFVKSTTFVGFVLYNNVATIATLSALNGLFFDLAAHDDTKASEEFVGINVVV